MPNSVDSDTKETMARHAKSTWRTAPTGATAGVALEDSGILYLYTTLAEKSEVTTPSLCAHVKLQTPVIADLSPPFSSQTIWLPSHIRLVAPGIFVNPLREKNTMSSVLLASWIISRLSLVHSPGICCGRFQGFPRCRH
jgi:hypothetical protein